MCTSDAGEEPKANDRGNLGQRAAGKDMVIARLPDAPEGAEIASVDVVIRLRKRG